MVAHKSGSTRERLCRGEREEEEEEGEPPERERKKEGGGVEGVVPYYKGGGGKGVVEDGWPTQASVLFFFSNNFKKRKITMVKKIRQEKPLKSIEDVKENAPAAQGKVARALASVHPQTREKGLRALTLWLSKRKDITDKDMLRLWKALFFCFWHSDLVPVQVCIPFSTFSPSPSCR